MKSIEARAVMSASDATGNVLDKIATKFKGLERNAKALEGLNWPKSFALAQRPASALFQQKWSHIERMARESMKTAYLPPRWNGAPSTGG